MLHRCYTGIYKRDIRIFGFIEMFTLSLSLLLLPYFIFAQCIVDIRAKIRKLHVFYSYESQVTLLEVHNTGTLLCFSLCQSCNISNKLLLFLNGNFTTFLDRDYKFPRYKVVLKQVDKNKSHISYFLLSRIRLIRIFYIA